MSINIANDILPPGTMHDAQYTMHIAHCFFHEANIKIDQITNAGMYTGWPQKRFHIEYPQCGRLWNLCVVGKICNSNEFTL